ncbi:MAG: right-handed parallel beta-helix repeat-containing protein [Candidatus Firestonebacteria bacterium]|nr:right-handed parallel beta-helix repeat-containing protein [Candidatus Firestonebacteria bacterium]
MQINVVIVIINLFSTNKITNYIKFLSSIFLVEFSIFFSLILLLANRTYSSNLTKYDTSLPCITCHFDRKYLMHPINISMEGKGLKTTLPLNNSKITCLTCHKYHTDDPLSRIQLHDTTYTFLLRIPNVPVSSLCVNCHDNNKYVIGTNHDMKVTAPGEKNVLGQTTNKMGPCSACHLAHNGLEINLWAKEMVLAPDITSMFCKGCHNEKGCASTKNLNEFMHPMLVSPSKKGLTTTLPLFNEDGKPSYEGEITCVTCHNVHQWAPDEKKQGLYKKEIGASDTKFLRINNQKNSELCTNCHKLQGLVIGTPHDLVEVSYNEKNIQGITAGSGGQCSACHLIHNGKDKENFAREYGQGEDVITQKCTSCHSEGKIADKRLIGANSHPINVALASWKMSTNLPLYDREGGINQKGTIKCITCHNVHQWTSDKTKLGKVVAKEKVKLTINMIQKGIVGEIVFVKGNQVYINHTNDKITVAKDDILYIFKEEREFGRLKVLNYNPFAKESEIFANIITDEIASKLGKGDIVYNPKFLDASSSGTIAGDGTNSFLRMQNSSSKLCISCHKHQESIIGTKHDISVNFPNNSNIRNEKNILSGPCSSCHTPHNSVGVYLSAISSKSMDSDRRDYISKLCTICHSASGIANTKVLRDHHLIRIFPSYILDLTPPPTFMPLYEIGGRVGFWDYVSCSTCHNVHQWDPEKSEKRDFTEGDETNSFLRMPNNDKQLCEACHINEVNLKMKEELKKETKKTQETIIVEDKKEEKIVVISEGGPKIEVLNPKTNSILTRYEHDISGTIDDPTVTRAQVLVNGKPYIISVSAGSFSDKIILKEGKNHIRVLATNPEGKSGASGEIVCTVDTRRPMVIQYEYTKPVTLTDDFRLKVVFNQTMNADVLPFIYFVTSDKKTIVPEIQISTSAKFINQFEEIPLIDSNVIKEMKNGEILLNAKIYYGYGNMPQVIVKDTNRDKNPGPFNDSIKIKVTSISEPEGEVYDIKESNEYPGIFIGRFEFGRWVESGDKLVTIDDKETFTVTYYLAEYTSTNIINDTFITNPIKITREMKGTVHIVVENAMGINGNLIDKDNTESFIVNPDLFYIKNTDTANIDEGEITRTINIHLKFSVPDAQKMIISEDPEFKSSEWEPYKNEKEFFLSNSIGHKTLYIKFKNKFSAESPVINKKISYIPIEYKTVLNKDIDKDVFLTKEMGPFLVTKSINITQGATLTIGAGVKFWIDASASPKIQIIVDGIINTVGSEFDRIVFTSNAVKPIPGDWIGIKIINSKENVFKYTDVNYAEEGFVALGSDINIENCKFERNKTAGVVFDQRSTGSVLFSEFRVNGIGIQTKDISNPEISNNYIVLNEVGISCESISSPKIINNIILKSAKTGISCTVMAAPPISDNNISQNIEYGIYIINSAPMIYQNNIIENSIGIFCEKYLYPFLIKNNNLFNNKDYSMKLNNFTENLDVAKNWWGVRNPDIIKKIVYDNSDDPGLGKLVFLPFLEAPAASKNVSIVIDKVKPKVLTAEFQNPANITSFFQVSLVFDESINPYILPKITMVLPDGKSIVPAQGIFSSINSENDTYITPFINLDESMAGEIKLYIENVQDLTGNLMDKTPITTFILDPVLNVKEGFFISKPEITLQIKTQDAYEMIISENPNFKNAAWEAFASIKNIELSKEEGKKSIYFRTRKKTGILSPVSQYVLFLDKTPPRIINQVYNVPKVDESFKLTLYFNERLNINCKPKITLRSNNKNEFVLPQGNFVSSSLINDTYIIPATVLSKDLEGYLTVIVEDITDLSGNKIDPTSMNNLFRYDIIPPSPMVKIEGGNFTQKNEIILIFEKQEGRVGVETMLSEDKDFKDAKWEELKTERGFNLSQGEGEKNIYLKFRDKIGYESSPQKVTVFIDRKAPQIISYSYPKPARISNDFQIKIQFDESIDTTNIPSVSLTSTGDKSPVISGNGSFSSSKFPDDTYISPIINLDENMGGAITIVVAKVYDIAKNILEMEMKETFNFDTYAPIASDIIVKQGEFIREPKVNFMLSVIGARKMMISESIEFADSQWLDYAAEYEYILSNQDGVKKVYFKFEDESGNVSKPKRVEITMDRSKPIITKFDFPSLIEFNKPFQIAMHFSEGVMPKKPAIVLMSTSRLNYLIANEGTFKMDVSKNDIYVTPEIILDESMKGGIVIVIDQVVDVTGNKMDSVGKLLFYVGEEDPRSKKIRINGGEYTARENITLLLSYEDVKEINISEDPECKKGKWINFKNKVPYVLSKSPGEKNLCISLRHIDDKIEKQYIKVILDKTAPEVIKYVFPEQDPQLFAQVKLIFSETLDKNYPPTVVLTDGNGENILLSEKGSFATTNMKYDTYITSVIPKYKDLSYPLIFSITNAQDLAGNLTKLFHIVRDSK